MRIGNTSRTGSAGKGSARTGRTGSGFSLSGTEKSTQAAGPRAAGGISGVDALLTIQGVDAAKDATSGKARAVRRGHTMLDVLEDLKLDLLAGQISEAKLETLVRLVEDRNEDELDPQLAGVLEEIELRARVELAKHARH